MALSIPTLTGLLLAELTAQFPPAGNPTTIAELTGLSVAIATAVVNHLQADAIVSPIGVPPMSNAGGAVAGFGKVL